jgi:uncharacterized protein (DUF885 family)
MEVEIGKIYSNSLPIYFLYINFGAHTLMGQFAGGTSAQPFKTEQDYTNFLKRMDKYSVWIDSAMVYMKKEWQKEYY